MTNLVTSKGLAGVVVDKTAISDVQGDVGLLSYRGRDIDELVGREFSSVAGLLVGGKFTDQFGAVLSKLCNLTVAEERRVLALDAQLHPMRVLQAMVSVLDSAPELGFGEADQGIYVAAKIPAIVSTYLNQQGVQLDAEVDYAERFLRALPDATSSPDHVAAFNAAQILQLEHSFNAGTFAARVVASTLAPVTSAISAGIGALSGPLHGGADQAVIEVVDGLRSTSDAKAYVDATLRDNGKIPGMGHREYRVRDPRAKYMYDWAKRLSGGTGYEQQFELLELIELRFRERMQERGKELHANVEFYKGLVYRIVGLPDRYFTAGFAMARVFGYIAHFIESRIDNRIFRPAAEYVGPPARKVLVAQPSL